MTTKTPEKGLAAAEAVFNAPVLHAGNRGLERGSQEDMILPNVLLMQPMSKLVTDKGNQTGTFVNSLSEANYGTSFEFIPLVYTKYWNVLKANGNKMEFDYRVFNADDQRLVGKRRYKDGDKKAEIQEVRSFLGLIDGAPAVVKFKSTSTQGGKKLYTLASLSRKDLFATKYKLFSVKQTGELGTYWIIDVEPIGAVTEKEWETAQSMYAAFAPKSDAVVDAGGEE